MPASKYALIIAIGVVGLSGCGGGGGSSAVRPSGGGSAGTTTLLLSPGIARLDGGSANNVSYSIAFGGTETDVTLTPTIDGSAIAPIVHGGRCEHQQSGIETVRVFEGRRRRKTYDLPSSARSATKHLHMRATDTGRSARTRPAHPTSSPPSTPARQPLAGIAGRRHSPYTGLSVTPVCRHRHRRLYRLRSDHRPERQLQRQDDQHASATSPASVRHPARLQSGVTGTVSGNQFSGTTVCKRCGLTLGNGTAERQSSMVPQRKKWRAPYGIAIGANQGHDRRLWRRDALKNRTRDATGPVA